MVHTHVPLDSTPASVREAREVTRRWLRNVEAPVVEPTAMLVVSELVTNAIVHARGPVVLHLWHEGDGIRIGVTDGSTAVARIQPARAGASSGRGMHLVERFSSRWGTELRENGKLTWAEIPAGP